MCIRDRPGKMEYEIIIQPTITDDEHYALTEDIKKACDGKFTGRHTKEIGEHFFIYTKK